MIWLKRQEQLDAGHEALVGVMDALLHLQQGSVVVHIACDASPARMACLCSAVMTRSSGHAMLIRV